MAASISGREPGRVSGQAKIDVLIVGDGAVQPLANAVQKLFSNLAEVTVTVGDMQGAWELLADRGFHLVFLRMTSSAAGEREAARTLGFGRKKNTRFLFVFIIPENFKGCVSGLGADVTITEPLTTEKLSIVGRYWRTHFAHTVKSENSAMEGECGPPQRESCSEPRGCFSADRFACSESLRNDIGLELKASLSDFERSKRISLHSSKEKLRRERIKHSCEQLRALVPGGKGRKSDAASVLEATVEHMKRLRDQISPAVLGQITEALRSNSRFCRKQASFQLPLPSQATAPRENSVLASTHPPVRENSFLANRCLNVCPAPASGGPSVGAVGGPPSPAPKKTAGGAHQGQAPSPAPPLSSLQATRCCPTAVPTWDAAATTNQSASGPLPAPGLRAPTCAPPHCSSSLGQACAAPPACLVSPLGPAPSSQRGPDVRSAASALVRDLSHSSNGPCGLSPQSLKNVRDTLRS
ncbi:spermatogenesis- and oogenesis-specific basic helix-loop-helix-containing protein 2 [Sturnira hondurensis]|uniref:spermatogenesis- and oogenesis-specific basic helix-loop-helix-containing protein 2 n=1 Tax=Sturnira hondurensis TaxID=192404 RepID=UPI00187A6B83|nr:spermatogenesis- and oogenesis-specific basic helix-loop-helix-containing protein 2 [Sturnira hondurensis]